MRQLWFHIKCVMIKGAGSERTNDCHWLDLPAQFHPTCKDETSNHLSGLVQRLNKVVMYVKQLSEL